MSESITATALFTDSALDNGVMVWCLCGTFVLRVYSCVGDEVSPAGRVDVDVDVDEDEDEDVDVDMWML